jgi:hypothetical protein
MLTQEDIDVVQRDWQSVAPIAGAPETSARSTGQARAW